MASWQGKFASYYLRRFYRLEVQPDTMMLALRQKVDKLAAKIKYRGKTEVTPVSIGTMRAEWIRPQKCDPARVILYLHGGGYCIGSIESHRQLVMRLCEAAEARGLLIDYRLAPEHPFPAALDDAVTAYRWLLSQNQSNSGIVLAGDSAGGGLAIATAMALRDGGAPLPRALVTMSPWTDTAMTGWTMTTNARKDPVLNWETIHILARHYLKNTNPTNPFVSPLYGNFKGLPPLLIHVGSNEILRDDATRAAEKAELAGVDVSCEVWDGMPHVFQGLPFLPESQGSLDRIGSFIRSRVPSANVAVSRALPNKRNPLLSRPRAAE